LLTVTIQDQNDVVTLRCAGKVVSGAETSILCTALGHYERDVILDLTEVDEIDGAGVGALIALQAAGIYLRLKDLAEPVREALSRTGAESIFEICDPPAERNNTVMSLIQPVTAMA